MSLTQRTSFGVNGFALVLIYKVQCLRVSGRRFSLHGIFYRWKCGNSTSPSVYTWNSSVSVTSVAFPPTELTGYIMGCVWVGDECLFFLGHHFHQSRPVWMYHFNREGDPILPSCHSKTCYFVFCWCSVQPCCLGITCWTESRGNRPVFPSRSSEWRLFSLGFFFLVRNEF